MIVAVVSFLLLSVITATQDLSKFGPQKKYVLKNKVALKKASPTLRRKKDEEPVNYLVTVRKTVPVVVNSL